MAKTKLSRTLNKIRTPIELLNATLGNGIPFGKIVEFYGKNKSGKSTCALQTASIFLEDYPNGKVVIIDSESNYSDTSRLEKVFGLAPCNEDVEALNPDPRVRLYFTGIIEEAFGLAIKYVEESKKESCPTLILIDSLSALAPAKNVDELNKSLNSDKAFNPYSGGMALTPRVLSENMGYLLGKLPTSYATVFVVSQVTVDMSNPYMVTMKAKGGIAKEHALHLSLCFDIQNSSLKSKAADSSNADLKKATNNFIDASLHDDNNIKPITLTKLDIKKNKISIALDDCLLCINNTIGGKFVPEYELFMSLSLPKGLFVKAGNAYVCLNDTLKEKYIDTMITYKNKLGELVTTNATDNFILKEIATSKEMAEILRTELRNYYINEVEGVSYIYRHMEEYRQKYFPNEII